MKIDIDKDSEGSVDRIQVSEPEAAYEAYFGGIDELEREIEKQELILDTLKIALKRCTIQKKSS